MKHSPHCLRDQQLFLPTGAEVDFLEQNRLREGAGLLADLPSFDAG